MGAEAVSNLLTPAEVAEIKRRAEKALPPDWQEKMKPGHWFTLRDEFGNPEQDENGRPKRGWCDDPACATNKERAKLFGPHRDILRLLADREVLVQLLARAHGYLIQLVDDNDIFIDPEDVERVNEFCKEIEDAGILAQVEGQET